MPLHDWNLTPGWEGVHHIWMTELARLLKARLPTGYRAIIGSVPVVGVDSGVFKPDVSVRTGPETEPEDAPSEAESLRPDFEAAVAELTEESAVFVERAGRLVAAVELISLRNKDRPDSRRDTGLRYLSYLKNGVHLMIVDVHPRPRGFSFAAMFHDELGFEHPGIPVPMAASYRVGEPLAEMGRFLAVWQRPMTIGESLPELPLPLTVHESVVVDLESTYARAASDAYLD